MKITAATKVEELLRAHPYLEEFLAGLNPKFEMLRNKAARATIGRLANLRAAATIGGMEVEALLQAVAGEIERHFPPHRSSWLTWCDAARIIR